MLKKNKNINKAVITDIDNILCEPLYNNILQEPSEVKFLYGVLPALKKLNDNDIPVYLVSNQFNVGEGKYTEEHFLNILDIIGDIISNFKIKVIECYYCTEPDGVMEKPNPTMINQLKNDFNLNDKDVFLISNNLIDIEAGNLGQCKTILLSKKHNGDYNNISKIVNTPLYVTKSFIDASNLVTQYPNIYGY